MSMRGTKRASGVRGEEGGSSKRRRTEPEDALWQLRPVSDLKMSSIYNRSASEAPAELFRKDLISAMKLPDSEPLVPSEYWVITDTWKQDWERGVQVPVNPDSLPAPKVKIIENKLPPDFQEFKLPKDKYIHLNRDAHYDPTKHHLSTAVARAEAACSYDLDATDTAWLKLLNAERARAGAQAVTEDQLERVIEELEVRCWDKIQAIMKSEEGLGIEYDENVICDVCRSPDSEDGNEMVFCDSCNICVHQACYGITVIPPGQWLCRPCGDGVRPTCVLCPNLGGAMKCTPSGSKWAHVSCVLWIPEVSIGCAEKMEPITKISAIPPSRWSLVCVLCRERKGACIQCSVKTCKTAYHVTCAFKHGLEMRAIIEDENADDGVKLRSYCQKHSVNSKKEKSGSGSEEEEVKRKRRKDMTSEEKSQARAARLQEIEREFDKHVSIKDISTHLLDVDQDAIYYIYNYWKLKRRAGHNRPLLPPKSDDSDLLSHRQEQADLDKMKMFVQLRQDLERVRNLCYMVSRREKLSRSFFRMREQTFHKQVAVLSADKTIAGADLSAIIEANHGPSIYDRLYSHADAPDHKNDFDDLLARIAGPDSVDDKKKDLNGLLKGSKSLNPYKKHYVNGSSRRSGSMYSGLSSEESAPDINRPSNKYRGRAIGSSTDEEAPKRKALSPKKKVSPKLKGKKSPLKGKKRQPQSKALVESSSEEEPIKSRIKKDMSRSKTLQQMEKEMTAGKGIQSATDSDDLMPVRLTRNNKFPVDIYSDSSENEAHVKTEEMNSDKSPNATNDSQQQSLRTKAAMKEFIPTQPEQKVESKEVKKRGRKPSSFKDKKIPDSDEEAKNKENIKYSKTKDNPTDLIVPQRQAAKKASENMRSTTTVKVKDEVSGDKQTTSGDDSKGKPKIKPKKEGKEIKEKEVPAKGKEITKRKSSTDIDKETIAYVPQRQAAKKAAAHIKSGLGSKPAVADVSDEKKKLEQAEKPETSKNSPKKEDDKITKSPQNSSSSSSSNSSSSSYTSSSSSEEEEEKVEAKPMVKAREIKPLPRQPPLFSPSGTRPTVDLPFLDRVSRPLSSTSASSDSESSKCSRYSGSSSPTPKRPRRRRKGKSLSSDTSPRKAPDKKFKTSERRSECGVPSPSAEGEEPGRANDARAATRFRTRSTTSSGNMPYKCDAGPRKPSKDDAPGTNKSPKESSKPSELPTPERKTDETMNKKLVSESSKVDVPKIDVKATIAKSRDRRGTVSTEEKDLPVTEIVKRSPVKAVEQKHKNVIGRRLSILDPPVNIEQNRETPAKGREISRRDSMNTTEVIRKSVSPMKKLSIEKSLESERKISPIKINDNYSEVDKAWFPKVPSPLAPPSRVEKPDINEKYHLEDRSMDSDSIDKTSIKMIAKIQATLNENTMIKSPKTPLDARTNIDIMDVEHPLGRNIRKRSILDTDKKFTDQDASHVQGVEISKRALIPSAQGNQFPGRSMFSPQCKENELFELDLLSVDDGFNHDELIKPFTPYPEAFIYKEDSKEQGVQETLNLVDRLRMQLSTKKISTETSGQGDMTVNEDNQASNVKDNAPTNFLTKDLDIMSSSKDSIIDLVGNSPQKNDYSIASNHIANTTPPVDLTPHDVASSNSQSMTSSDKWPDVPVSQAERILDQNCDSKYDNTNTAFSDEIREPTTVQSDIHSMSEIDRDTVSKQSDDSQSLSVVDHSILSNDQESLTQNHQNYDNNNSLIHSDCATISSPYVSQESKWRESKITQRRSSASSTNSEGSVCSQKTEMKSHLNSCDSHTSSAMPDIDYPPLPAYSLEPPLALSQYAGYPSEPSPFMSSIGLFPGGLASPAGSMYGAGSLSGAFGAASLLAPLPKPTFPAMCAAFTSSSQNLALTAAMVAPPTPRAPDPDPPATIPPSAPYPPPVTDKHSNDNSNETVDSFPLQDSKSPTKAPKTTPRSVGSSKSPGKSPGFSPKQTDAHKSSKRPSNRNNRSQRGRGRSKSRGQGGQFPPNVDYMGNSIQSKLVGTVYDFDEEIANDGVDLKALRERRKSVDSHDKKSSVTQKEASASPGSPAVVAPVLPGPVDMRTYQTAPAAASAPPPAYSHLLAFASGTAEQQLADIDEEMEKQLHSALMASKPEPPPPPTPEPPLPKVSLSDSRNQLKVKIKGPFLDANYSSGASAVTPAPAPAAVEVAAGASVGPGNLRRMRKKELLRQYWTQDMNMEEPAPLVAPAPPPARAVITIPKAVASMTSIPSREDYRPLADLGDKKKRKEASEVRRGRPPARPPRPAAAPAVPLAPKLKIKIGANFVQPVAAEETPSFQFRPPKKRFPKPSVDDLRRESMKYRRKVMADFEEDEKVKKHKPNKSGKHKKKKDKKAERLQVINSDSDSATKLIIKIKRAKEEEAGVSAGPAAGASSEAPVDPFEYDPARPDPLAIDPPSYAEASSALRKIRTAKVTPIRLKLARSAEGSGYVMKGAADSDGTLPLSLNKHCEVR